MLFSSTFTLLASAAASVSAAALPAAAAGARHAKRGGSISVTPHDKYSSSIGVLGCKIDVNRVAYWPLAPDCDNLCAKVSANGRSVHLLRVDQSGGAYDISYDAWNYLATGQSARDAPTQGGGIDAVWEDVPVADCVAAGLLANEPGARLAFSAANSMNFIASCPADSWVAQHSALYNILNPICTWGLDETCVLPSPDQGNQPVCPHQLGLQEPLTSQPVHNIVYGTGASSLAQ
ncbi:hypothetical protein GGS23DRAFT_618531 [Durotheca rogersii]|uniref:uncharacterized protein n=1 Tax=Durotheca rogersii TaxID=419775 RepID=UPI00221EE0E0|nr:uncharacterized protein GGS23DRAFT_618531 [Durotheca rogersii]KAI5865481.1 hypothetical protein GGS23DRAFT_618531 [Durotheca rogersii]